MPLRRGLAPTPSTFLNMKNDASMARPLMMYARLLACPMLYRNLRGPSSVSAQVSRDPQGSAVTCMQHAQSHARDGPGADAEPEQLGGHTACCSGAPAQVDKGRRALPKNEQRACRGQGRQCTARTHSRTHMLCMSVRMIADT